MDIHTLSRRLSSWISANRHPVSLLISIAIPSFFLCIFLISNRNIETVSPEVGFTSVSPTGESGGIVVPASCASNLHDDPWYGSACNACNACGACNSGSIQCSGIRRRSRSGTPEYGIWDTMGVWWGERLANTLGLTWTSFGIVNPLGSPGACNVSAPALPSGYGSGCWSAPNACGAQGWGTINCAGACTGVTPPNPSYLGNACSVANVCGVSNSGTYLCSGACSVGAPALPSGYGTACTSAANNCGSTNSGVIGCSGCSAVAPANIPLGSACSGPANACGMTIPGTITCGGCSSTVAPSDALCDLAICKNSCSSTLNRSGNFTVASGPPSTTLKACFYQAGTGACTGGVDVTGSATWTETNAPKDAIYFSPTGVLNARYVNGDETFNVSYLGVTKSPRVTVTCIPNTCSIAAAKTVTDTYCPEVTQDTGVPTGCDGMTLVCPGTRKCNYNWREIAP